MAKKLNINFLVDKENERVVVSNEKGTMKPREYQDNIREVLIKEDIVKELESDYSIFKSNRTTLEGKIEDTNKKIEKNRKEKKKDSITMVCTLIGMPIIINVLFYIFKFPLGIETILIIGAITDGMFAIIFYFLNHMPDSPIIQIKELEEHKKDYENSLQELNLEIADLVQVLTKNKAELQELIEQKETNNIEMCPTEVQEISYREALEFEKSYLAQLRSENSSNEQTKEDEKNSILSRFKRNKNEY